jgi:hypothetical protein
MPTTLGPTGITFTDGSSLRSTPFRFEHSRTSGQGFGGSYRNFADHTQSPDWTLPAKANCNVYIHLPCRNDTTSWGGMFTRLYYRVNSGAWTSMGDSGYSAVMINNFYSIAYYANEFNLDFSSITSSFTLGFLLQCAPYNGGLEVITSNNIGGGTSTGVSSTNGVLNQYGFYTKIIVTGDAAV